MVTGIDLGTPIYVNAPNGRHAMTFNAIQVDLGSKANQRVAKVINCDILHINNGEKPALGELSKIVKSCTASKDGLLVVFKPECDIMAKFTVHELQQSIQGACKAAKLNVGKVAQLLFRSI